MEKQLPKPVRLNKIEYDVVVSGETIANGQTKSYKGRRSLTVKNTNIHSGGKATFTSQKSILFLPGFTANAGSYANIRIAFPGCDDFSFPKIPRRDDDYLLKNQQETKKVEISFEKDITENFIAVFPNPTTSTVTIQLYSNNKDTKLNHIKLYDIFGRTILSQPTSENPYVLDVSQCPQGFYFIEANDNAKSHYNKLIIK
jgi:hypothetical protein